jgi:hypothetical protein
MKKCLNLLETCDAGLRDTVDLEIIELQLYGDWAMAPLIDLDLFYVHRLKRPQIQGRNS